MTEQTCPYRGLIADFGGVVSTSFDGALRSFCIREGLAADALARVFSLDGGAKGLLTDLERGQITQRDFVDHLAPALGVDPDNLLQRILADLALEPAVVSEIARVRATGVRVAVLSNSWGTDPDNPFDPYLSYDLAGKFDVVVLSHEVKLRKPQPEIFQLTADRLYLTTHDCLFIDDVGTYLEPAAQLGMGTIHAGDPDATVRELRRAFPQQQHCAR